MDPSLWVPFILATILFYLAVFYRRCTYCSERTESKDVTLGPSSKEENRVIIETRWKRDGDMVQKEEKYPLYRLSKCTKCKRTNESACWSFFGRKTTDWIPVGHTTMVTSCGRCKGVGIVNLKVYNVNNQPVKDLRVDCFLCEGHGWIK
jgi:hypothetical protein